MELRQVRYFIAVAERLSYSKAARELHVSVSPLSRQIRQLEEEFGVLLFLRDRRRVQLTDAGRMFLEEAKALVNHSAEVSGRLRMAQKGESGAVRIGVGLHLGDKVGAVVAEHARLYPEVDVQCRCIFSTRQNAALREGDIDVGFMRPPVDEVLASELLYEERLVVLVGKPNPLSKRRSLRTSDLAEQTVFLPESSVGGGLREKILHLFAKAGVTPRISPLISDPSSSNEVHKVLLAANKGIFIIADESGIRSESGSAAVPVPLEDPDAKIGLFVAWRKGERSRSVLSLIDTSRKVLATSAAGSAARGVGRVAVSA